MMEAGETLPSHIGRLINAGVEAGMSIGAAGALAAEIYAAGRLDGQFLGAVGPIGVADGGDGMVLLRQDSSVVSIATRDVVRIARELLIVAGFELPGIHQSSDGVTFSDLADGDLPDAPSQPLRSIQSPVETLAPTLGGLFEGVRQ